MSDADVVDYIPCVALSQIKCGMGSLIKHSTLLHQETRSVYISDSLISVGYLYYGPMCNLMTVLQKVANSQIISRCKVRIQCSTLVWDFIADSELLRMLFCKCSKQIKFLYCICLQTGTEHFKSELYMVDRLEKLASGDPMSHLHWKNQWALLKYCDT